MSNRDDYFPMAIDLMTISYLKSLKALDIALENTKKMERKGCQLNLDENDRDRTLESWIYKHVVHELGYKFKYSDDNKKIIITFD